MNRAKFYFQQSIRPKDWNSESGEARKSLTGYSDFNAKLKKISDTCENLHTSLTKDGTFTLDTLREKFKTFIEELNNRKKSNLSGEVKNFETLTNFATHYLKTVEATKSKNTLRHNRQTLRLLHEFETLKKKRLTFDRITLDFYHDFVEFLTRSEGYAQNSIGKHIGNVKLFLNEATERGINSKFDYKSKRFKKISEKVETIFLTEEELLKIYRHDFSKEPRLDRVRDLFIVGCFTGLRFSDFSQLRIENITGDTIKVKTQKTGEMVVIPVHWTLREILTKYAHLAKGLPPKISNQKMNEYLKEIGKKVGFTENILRNKTKGGLRVETSVPQYELITSHTCRRSFATNLYLSGFPSISIMQIIGHRTEKAFMNYIKVSKEENAKLLQLHWAKNVKLRAVV